MAEPDPAIVARWSAPDVEPDSPARLTWEDEWLRSELVRQHPHLAVPWARADAQQRKAWATWVLRAHRLAQRDLARRR